MLSYIAALEEAFLETSDATNITPDFQIKAAIILETLVKDITFNAIHEARSEIEGIVQRSMEVARDRVR